MEPILIFLIAHFQDLLDLNLTASIVILFVVCTRQLLKRAPKIFSYALWGIVLLRLLVPLSIESPVSVVPQPESFSRIVEVNEVLPEIQFETPQDRAENERSRESTAPGEPFTQVSRSFNAETYLTFLWLLGMAVMLLRSIVSYLRLKRRLRVAIPFRKRIFLADDIDTPFVMGILRPVIYLPGSLEGKERKYIIAHERHHIRRGDHIFKMLAYLALTIHWFNPLVWIAFVLASRDMEMSCDEAVIRRLGEDVRADYSASLLNLATGHRLFTGTPLAFGEGNPTGRVRNLAKWRKPAFWVILICFVFCAVLAVCLVTDPSSMYLYEIDGSRNYSDLLTNTDNITLIREGEEYLVQDAEKLLQQLDAVQIRKLPISRSRSEDRDKTNQIRLREKLYLNFSWDYTQVWIDNLVKPTYSYYVNDHRVIREIFETFAVTQGIAGSTEPPQNLEWGVSIQPDRVSRTGATALFVYSGSIPGEEGAELTYGDYLSLDRLVDGTWVPCDELSGYQYFVGDASYPVVNGYGMVHEWPDRFGELADGHYRLGKQVTLVRPDGSQESRMVYGEFVLPDSVRTGLIPLSELPELYSGEQAMLDGCFVTEDGAARENKSLFQAFAADSWNGIPGVIRIVNWHYGEDASWSAVDLYFDGNNYTLTTLESTYTFQYLRYFTGQQAWENADHDAFEYYILMNEGDITWQDVQSGKLETMAGSPAHWTVYADFLYLPDRPQLPPDPLQAVLEFDGKPLVTVTDFDRLEKLWLLFGNAEFLGYEPKTHSIGIGLNLVLKAQNGEAVTIELDPNSDICRISGEYVFYGAFDEPDYIEKLWYYLDIPSWPDSVYQLYPDALRP